MAKRYVYVVKGKRDKFYEELPVEFEWFPGFSIKQKQCSIASLHKNASKEYDLEKKKILEISSKSPNELGKMLSAFQLKLPDSSGLSASVESFFQGSKVFEKGGPYKDLYNKSAKDAKRDPRLKESGSLKRFVWDEEEWDLEPKTAFYHWLYLKALHASERLREQIMQYTAFTDIEFNPAKSINCQAASAALYVGIRRSGIQIEEALQNKHTFLQLINKHEDSTDHQSHYQSKMELG